MKARSKRVWLSKTKRRSRRKQINQLNRQQIRSMLVSKMKNKMSRTLKTLLKY